MFSHAVMKVRFSATATVRSMQIGIIRIAGASVRSQNTPASGPDPKRPVDLLQSGRSHRNNRGQRYRGLEEQTPTKVGPYSRTTSWRWYDCYLIRL